MQLRLVLALQVSLLLLAGSSGLLAQAKKSGAAKPAPGKATEEKPKFKAIWEPVPFNRDIELFAIHCSGPETCWVVGRKATILYTSDGGTTWKAQLGGDPDSTDEHDFSKIVFLDATHGWVLSSRGKLLSTSDGSAWSELGTISSLAKALWFVTPARGMLYENSDSTSRSVMNVTTDGGRTWSRTQPCQLDATIDGLARRLGCLPRDIHFVSPAVGFVGGAAPLDMGTSAGMFGRTADGGNTWSYSLIPASKHHVQEIEFWSEKDGIAVLDSGQVQWTADGGTTWTGSANSPSWRSWYAGAQGKILVGVRQNGNQVGYSFDGGRTFMSRAAAFPAEVNGVAFPDPRHGYAVGRSGMVFRYRIVPIDYNKPGMFAALAAP